MINGDKYQKILESIYGVVWEADATTLQFGYVSKNAARLLGYTPEEWMSENLFFFNHIYPQDARHVIACFRQPEKVTNQPVEFRMIKKDGRVAWIRNYISVIEDDATRSLCGIMMDITQKHLLGSLDNLERQVLELNADAGKPTEDILRHYVKGIELIIPEMKCSILRIEENKAYNWVSPSLPISYIQYINGISVGPNQGCCGTAAYLKKKVIVEYIAHDKKWEKFREIALANGLSACWSHPIINSAGEVVATFAMYYDKPKKPDTSDEAIIDRSVRLIRIILENRHFADTITEMNMMAKQTQELANFGMWQWDVRSNKAIWSDSLYHIYGLSPSTFEPTFEGYLYKIYAEDRERVESLLRNAHTTGGEVTFEERIVRPDGSIRQLRSWVKIKNDDSGNPQKYYGASLDVTDMKNVALRMEHIAWQQSHVVRAPLARIMGLVKLLKEGVVEDKTETEHLLEAILSTADEMDEVIKSITYDTKM